MGSAGWITRQERLQRIAARQLFFVGGAPRSGTTWLQQRLDAHPDVCCRGEGLFWQELCQPLEAMMAARRKALEDKNTRLFSHSGGYPLPDNDDTDMLLATGVLLGFARQCAGKEYRAIGEKTPENVFFFPHLHRLFPDARFIGIARDPRDVITSAWHFFRTPQLTAPTDLDKLNFIDAALPSLEQGLCVMRDMQRTAGHVCLITTYEAMHADPVGTARVLFRFLGVSDDDEVIIRCIENTSFPVASEIAKQQVAQGRFHRKGVVGDWRSTLTPEMNDIIIRRIGYLFPDFEWSF